MPLPNVPIKCPASFRLWTAFLAVTLGLPLGCGTVAPPEATPPAVVKWLEKPPQTTLDEYTELVGTSVPLPNHVYRVSARVEGSVVAVVPPSSEKVIAEGDKISAGAVIAQLNTTVITNSIAEAEKAQLPLVEDQKVAQNAVAMARREHDRLSNLAKEDQRRAREDSKYIPLVAPLQLESAASALRDAESRLKSTTALLSAAEKKLEALREQLKLHTLVSPLNGRLGRILVVPGQWLAVGTPVADVIDIDDEIDVLCFVAARQVEKLELGQPAHTGGPDDEVGEATGSIVFIADQAEPETGNFAVKVRLSNKEKHLRANRIVRLTVTTKTAPECISLPETAVQEDSNPPTVVVAEEEERTENGKTQTVFVARRLGVVLGIRDRKNHAVQLLGLVDTDKEEGKKKPVPDFRTAKYVTEGGQGVQTGDLLKLDKDED